jgi:hypothetical protein
MFWESSGLVLTFASLTSFRAFELGCIFTAHALECRGNAPLERRLRQIAQKAPTSLSMVLIAASTGEHLEGGVVAPGR